MSDKARLTLHPAFKETIPLPIAALCYRELGLGHGQVLYLIHLLVAQIRGELPINTGKIASEMGIDRRTVKKYNKALADMGLLVRDEEYLNGIQVENTYHLDRWLSQSLAILHDQQQGAIANLVNRLKTIDNMDDLRALISHMGSHMGGGDPTITGGGDPTITGGGDPTITPLPEVGGGDRRITPIDDDDQYIHQLNGNQSSSTESTQTTSAVQALLALTDPSGNRFSRQSANTLVYKALQHWGSLAGRYIQDWIDHASQNDRLNSPVGFVRLKIERGELPPLPAPPKQQIPPEYRDIIKR